MMTVEGNLLGGTRVWSREWWTEGDLKKDHQRFRCGTWRPPRCRNLGTWSCGENSWLTIDHDKRQMRTDHASVRRHAETVQVSCVGRQDFEILPKIWTTFVVDIGIFLLLVLVEKRFPEHLQDKM